MSLLVTICPQCCSVKNNLCAFFGCGWGWCVNLLSQGFDLSENDWIIFLFHLDRGSKTFFPSQQYNKPQQRHSRLFSISSLWYSLTCYWCVLLPFLPWHLRARPPLDVINFGGRMCGNEWWRATVWPIALLILTTAKCFESHVQPIM